jgi:hypothetical protein
MVGQVGSGLIDRRTVILSQRLVIAGSLMLTLGLVGLLLSAAGRLIPHTADGGIKLAALVLVVGGALCGVWMATLLIQDERAVPTEDLEPVVGSAPADAGPLNEGLVTAGPLNEGPVNEGRVWWRAANSPAAGWGPDTSDEWLRSLRPPQAPPPVAQPPQDQPHLLAQPPRAQPPPGSHGTPAQ